MSATMRHTLVPAGPLRQTLAAGRSQTSLIMTAQTSLRAGWMQRDEAPASPLGRLLNHHYFETFGGCVVLFNFVVMTMETHATAKEDWTVLNFVAIANPCLLFYYTIELILRLFVMRANFFRCKWNLLDLIIVVTGWVSEFLEIFNVAAGMEQIAMLKSLRMLRLLRLVRLFVAFRELYVLIAGVGRCMKTLLWASGLMFMVLNVWAILSVEFLDEKVKELVPRGAYPTCGWCGTAFADIWYANLTWFQIISTSDWATIGRPLADEYTWPYLFFLFNVFIVVWGLLNLIVAAIVDASIAGREDDIAIAAQMDGKAYQEAYESFAKICKDMDADGSGDVSVTEFRSFMKSHTELQYHLKIMGVQDQDVDELLKFADVDGSGTLEFDEFIEQFTLMRTLVEKTSLYFVLKYCQSIESTLVKQSEVIQGLLSELASVKSSSDRAKTSELMQSDSIPKAAASPSNGHSQTSDRKSAGAIKTNTQTLRASAQVDMPGADMKRLPPGWYYFGTSLPPEATAWCKAIDDCEVVCTSDAPAGRSCAHQRLSREVSCASDNSITKEAPVTSNTFHVRNAKHVCVKAPMGDIQLPHDVIEALASVDRFIDSIYNGPDAEDVPVTTDDHRWELLPSSSNLIHDAKHLYCRAPSGDVQLPPAIIQYLAAVDRFISSFYGDPSASRDDLAIEHGPVHDLAHFFDLAGEDAIDNDLAQFMIQYKTCQ